jgi:hypothetical protein
VRFLTALYGLQVKYRIVGGNDNKGINAFVLNYDNGQLYQFDRVHYVNGTLHYDLVINMTDDSPLGPETTQVVLDITIVDGTVAAVGHLMLFDAVLFGG